MSTIISKKVKSTSYSVTITETNYSKSDNKGLLLNKTLVLHANQYKDGVKIAVIWKDVASNDKFLMNLTDGKMLLKNSEFIPCTIFQGFDNLDSAFYTPINWGSKSSVICLNYRLNKF